MTGMRDAMPEIDQVFGPMTISSGASEPVKPETMRRR